MSAKLELDEDETTGVEVELHSEASAVRRSDGMPPIPPPGRLPREAISFTRMAPVGSARAASEPVPSQPQPSLPPPVARFAKYDVIGRVAIGGMAEIFLARETLPGGALRRTALKVIKRAPTSRDEDHYFQELFLREGRTVVQLAHPNICHVYDIGVEGEQLFIAMEWIDGHSLQDVLACLAARGELIPPAIAVGIAAQVASALEYAHTARDARGKRLNVVHRDVNPQNVMLRYDGAVKLVDFGVAQVSAEVDSRANTVKGKPAYMAPEQLRNETLDARTDVFALGICLYEMLSGLRLHKRPSTREIFAAVIQEPAPSLVSFVPDLSPELDDIVQRALQKRPEDRFQSAGELQAALESWLATRGEIGSARRVGELMKGLYPDGGRTPLGVDTSEEATACFAAYSQTNTGPFKIARLRQKRGLAIALALLSGVLLAVIFALASDPPAKDADTKAARAEPTQLAPAASTAPTPTPPRAVEAPAQAAPAAEPKAAESPSPNLEKPVERERPKRRRASPGFVADPGF